ncbi:MAG: hypothetical protein WC407_13820 [Sulfuricurvum sp.]
MPLLKDMKIKAQKITTGLGHNIGEFKQTRKMKYEAKCEYCNEIIYIFHWSDVISGPASKNQCAKKG